MKKSLHLWCSILILTSSCNSIGKEEAKKNSLDSTLRELSASMHPNKGYSAPKGFMGIDWLVSKQDAINIIKAKDSVKIKRVFDYSKRGLSEMGVHIELTGFFAGQRVKEIELTFLMDKLCMGEVNFGIKEQDFISKIVKELNVKYGEPKFLAQPDYNTRNEYTWNFDTTNRYHQRGAPLVWLYEDEHLNLLLDYYSVDFNVFLDQINAIEKSKTEKSVKGKDL